MTQFDILLNFLINILANVLKETKNKPTVIEQPQYQLQNIAYTRVVGVRFLTRWILISHETSYK